MVLATPITANLLPFLIGHSNKLYSTCNRQRTLAATELSHSNNLQLPPAPACSLLLLHICQYTTNKLLCFNNQKLPAVARKSVTDLGGMRLWMQGKGSWHIKQVRQSDLSLSHCFVYSPLSFEVDQ